MVRFPECNKDCVAQHPSTPTSVTELPIGYLSVEQVVELPTLCHLKPATLAKWRQLGKGPNVVYAGPKAFYRLSEIHLWLLEQKRRTIPVPESRVAIDQRNHRLGRHVTRADMRDQSLAVSLRDEI